MVTAFLFGIGFLFLIVAHSTLLFFKSKNSSSMPIAEMIFPWPKDGRLVSILCLSLSATSFFFMLHLPYDLHYPITTSAWKILAIFFIFPSIIYSFYIIRRINKNTEGFLYLSPHEKNREWAIPMIISAAISILFFILN